MFWVIWQARYTPSYFIEPHDCVPMDFSKGRILGFMAFKSSGREKSRPYKADC
jgi:hypothetical protein